MGDVRPWSSFGLANSCRLWSRGDEQNKFMNFVIIMDCCQVFGASVSGSTKQTKFLFATWPSHNYLLIVYIMLMVSPASHLCVCLSFFCLVLFYSSPAKLLFPNSNKFWLVWTERQNCDARSKKMWNEVRSFTASAMASTSSWFFFGLTSLEPNKSPSPLTVIYAELFIHVNACVALQYSIEILLCTVCMFGCCGCRVVSARAWMCVLPSENNK